MLDTGALLTPAVLLGLASAVLSTAAYLPYIIDTIAGRTAPERASWLIWAVLSSIAFFAQVWEGAGASLWFIGAQMVGTVLIFLLSIRRGVGGLASRTDFAVLCAAAFGLVLWYFTDSAVFTLAIIICISMMGGVITIIKAYRAPTTETLSTWVLNLIASFCGLGAVGQLDPVMLAYPLYLFVLYGLIVGAVLIGRRVGHGTLMTAVGEDEVILVVWPDQPGQSAPIVSFHIEASGAVQIYADGMLLGQLDHGQSIKNLRIVPQSRYERALATAARKAGAMLPQPGLHMLLP